MFSNLLRRIEWRLLPASAKEFRRKQAVLDSYARDYLNAKGWHRSAIERKSIDAAGQPVPWITYPARAFLERILRKDDRLFEFGAGNSSLWWAALVGNAVTVEHDAAWADDVARRAPNNLTVIAREIDAIEAFDDKSIPMLPSSDRANFADLPESMAVEHGLVDDRFRAYVMELTRFPKGYFNVVVVDGMARTLATWVACHYIAENGLIVFDNSDRAVYNEAFLLLAQQGFKRIDFYGSGPVNTYEWCTSIFARDFEWLSRNQCIPITQASDVSRQLARIKSAH